MNTKTILWIVIGILFLVAVFLVWKAGLVGETNGGGKIDITGWTENERMNYEMHGIIPARAQQSNSQQQTSSGGMVGGC